MTLDCRCSSAHWFLAATTLGCWQNQTRWARLSAKPQRGQVGSTLYPMWLKSLRHQSASVGAATATYCSQLERSLFLAPLPRFMSTKWSAQTLSGIASDPNLSAAAISCMRRMDCLNFSSTALGGHFSQVHLFALACGPYVGLWERTSQAAQAKHGSLDWPLAVAPVDFVVEDLRGPVPPVNHGFDLRQSSWYVVSACLRNPHDVAPHSSWRHHFCPHGVTMDR